MASSGSYMLMRGVSLFIKYLSENTLSILALTALFAAFHLIFLTGGALRDFAENAARFDTVRVYAQTFPDTLMDKISSADGVERVEKVYSPSDTKEYVSASAAFTAVIETLPSDFFPSFAELKVKPEYRNYNDLKRISEELSGFSGVESVSFGEKWIEGLSKLRFSLEAVLAVCAAIFAAAGGIIIHQTVSVSLYRYRREIRIYAVVGGTRAFVIVPFVVVSACISIICLLFSSVIFRLLAGIIRSKASAILNIHFAQSYGYWAAFAFISLTISMLSGFISAKHFLNRRLS
jgi:cell division transport system permease protein